MDIFYYLVEVIVILTLTLIFCRAVYIHLVIKNRLFNQNFNYKPAITVLMSCFNEGKAVYETITKVLESNYPKDKLFIIAIDDCSKDDSWSWIQKVSSKYANITSIRNEINLGKSKSLLKGLNLATTEYILNIDSDGAIHPNAISELVSCFTDPNVGGVGGNILVRNSKKNWLTQMQSLQYNTAFQFLKVIETMSGSINCISGALFMVKREIYNSIADSIYNRSWLGLEVKEGEDRFMTNLIINLGYKTIVNNNAKMFTDVPEKFKQFFSQQLRWRRGFFRTFLWIIQPSVFKIKLKKTSSITNIRLYIITLLLFLLPLLITWTLIVHGIVYLIILKIYLILILTTIQGIGYLIAKLNKTEIDLDIRAFIILPIWTLIDLTLLSALASFTLMSTSWETRTIGANK